MPDFYTLTQRKPQDEFDARGLAEREEAVALGLITAEEYAEMEARGAVK